LDQGVLYSAKMKNTTILMIAGILVLAVGGFIFINSNNNVNGNSTAVDNGNSQKIVLSLENYNYYPNTITVKAGQPVSISLDKSVGGCLRSFTIPSLGLSKNLRTPQDTLDFTPTQKGTYKFACSMGMGTGTLIVE
jgi:plastocyanin domain-containing protein